MFEQMDEDGDGEVTRHLDQGNEWLNDKNIS